MPLIFGRTFHILKKIIHKGGRVMAIVHATTQSFEQEVLHADKPVLVDFWAA